MSDNDATSPDPAIGPTCAMPPEIAAAIIVAQRAVRGAAHDALNEHHDFRYTTAEALICEGRRALNTAGLAVVSEGWRSFRRVEGGGFWHEERFMLVHESGATWRPSPISLPAVEIKGRPLDKAILGVDTTLHGYFLRSLLQIDRPNTAEEVSARDDRNYEPAKPEVSARDVTADVAAAKSARVLVKIRRGVEAGHADTDDGMARAIRAGAKHGADEATVRSWLTPRTDDPEAVFPAEDTAEERIAREDAAIAKACDEVDGVEAARLEREAAATLEKTKDLGPLLVLADCTSRKELLGAIERQRVALRALDTRILATALAEHAERLDVQVSEIDAALGPA